MTDEVLVQVENVSKKYCSNLRRSLRYGLKDIVNELLLQKKGHQKLRPKEFWALQDVSFELKRGETMGVIGVNGSGKTTLLSMLQGIIRPSKGRITIRGQVGALISLGAGFQPVLSGRENVYINAAILGVPKSQVKHRLDAILEFADIGDFIDSPVRTYSSGMKTRLGFATATHLVDPDVLLVDEVLATGDIAFRQKCFERMGEITKSGTTVVLVSHSMRLIERLCDKALLLHKGVVQSQGTASEVCQKYFEFVNSQTKQRLDKQKGDRQPANEDGSLGLVGEHADTSKFEAVDAELLDLNRQPKEHFQMREPVCIRARFIAHQPIDNLVAIFKFQTTDGIYLSSFSSYKDGNGTQWSGEGIVDCIVPEIPMREGQYLVDIGFFGLSEGMLFRSERVLTLSVIPDTEVYPSSWSVKGLIALPTQWEFERPDVADWSPKAIASHSNG